MVSIDRDGSTMPSTRGCRRSAQRASCWALGRRHPDVSARGCPEAVYPTSRGLASAIQERARSGAGQSAMTDFFAQHLIARLATVVMVAVELATTGVKRPLGYRGAVRPPGTPAGIGGAWRAGESASHCP